MILSEGTSCKSPAKRDMFLSAIHLERAWIAKPQALGCEVQYFEIVKRKFELHHSNCSNKFPGKDDRFNDDRCEKYKGL